MATVVRLNDRTARPAEIRIPQGGAVLFKVVGDLNHQLVVGDDSSPLLRSGDSWEQTFWFSAEVRCDVMTWMRIKIDVEPADDGASSAEAAAADDAPSTPRSESPIDEEEIAAAEDYLARRQPGGKDAWGSIQAHYQSMRANMSSRGGDGGAGPSTAWGFAGDDESPDGESDDGDDGDDDALGGRRLGRLDFARATRTHSTPAARPPPARPAPAADEAAPTASVAPPPTPPPPEPIAAAASPPRAPPPPTPPTPPAPRIEAPEPPVVAWGAGATAAAAEAAAEGTAPARSLARASSAARLRTVVATAAAGAELDPCSEPPPPRTPVDATLGEGTASAAVHRGLGEKHRAPPDCGERAAARGMSKSATMPVLPPRGGGARRRGGGGRLEDAISASRNGKFEKMESMYSAGGAPRERRRPPAPPVGRPTQKWGDPVSRDRFAG